jgi:hypothetical protein
VALKDKRERLEELEQDAETVLEYRTRMAPEALSVLNLEERYRFYKMLRLKITAFSDSSPEIQPPFRTGKI